jgi:hypothetical protein
LPGPGWRAALRRAGWGAGEAGGNGRYEAKHFQIDMNFHERCSLFTENLFSA